MENIKINPSKGALEVIKILEKAGYKADLVGGCVRDSVLNRPCKDEDITTNLQPEEVIKLFREKGYKVLPTGLQHGTITVMVEKVGYEVTTYRIDGEYEDARHPSEVTFTNNIIEDLKRRDFTINAMTYNPERGLGDYFDGISDIKNKIINTVGDPNERFGEDALRMMRAVRFASQLGFTIKNEVKEAIKLHAPDIKKVSEERVHDELIKILLSQNPAEGIRTLHDLGLLKEIAPEVEKCFDPILGRQTNPWHLYNVGEHSLHALEATPCDLVTRLAALLHDIGKPIVRSTDEKGIDHFYNHPVPSAELTNSLMKRLKFTTKETKDVVFLVRNHDNRFTGKRKQIEKFILNNQDVTPELFDKLLDLQKADCAGQNPELASGYLELAEYVRHIYHEIVSGPYKESDLDIDGLDIMCITQTMKGVPVELRGKEIAIAKKLALAYVLEDASRNNKEELIVLIRRNAKQIKTDALKLEKKK